MILGGTAVAAGLTMILALVFAVIAIPILIVGGIITVLLGLILPYNGPYYFSYDLKKKKMVKKKALN